MLSDLERLRAFFDSVNLQYVVYDHTSKQSLDHISLGIGPGGGPSDWYTSFDFDKQTGKFLQQGIRSIWE